MSIHMSFRKCPMTIDQQAEAWSDVHKAIDFLNEVYDIDLNKESFTIIFDRDRDRSKYYPQKQSGVIGVFAMHSKVVYIGEKRQRWYTYVRKRIGAATPDKGIKTSRRIIRRLTLVHEMTHLVQHLQGRSFSEIETTLNEIRYVERFHPSIAAKLEVIK